NLGLAAAWWISSRQQSRTTGTQADADISRQSTRTNYVVRRQIFSWREIESSDYPTYIANLRDIGCPEQTVRDIIIADVNALYARKRSLEIVTPEQQWWRTEPDTNIVQTAAARVHELEQERRELLTRLLGSNWETGDLVS